MPLSQGIKRRHSILHKFLKLCLISGIVFSPAEEAGGGFHADLTQRDFFIPDEIVVKFSSDASGKTVRRIMDTAGLEVVGEINGIGATILRIFGGDISQTLDELIQNENVIYAEPNYVAEITDVTPNDPGWVNQYNLAAIRAPQGWMLDTGAVWVTIAILDTGVDLSHPDLFVKLLPGYDFVNNDNSPQDDHGHGTHTAAIAAASSNNAVGISGVNWGANILPVKVLNASGNGTYANVSAGIIWATDHGAQVINLSLGGAAASFVLNDAVNYAYQNGVILVASTGNAGIPTVLYPAAYDPVIAVGATDGTNSWAGFSNYGPEVDVVAPGVNIYSAFPGGGYGYRSGTSMSAPHVSGLAALLWGIPGNGPANIRTLIESTSLDLGDPGWDPYFGNGLIQMDLAILNALPPPTFTPTFTPTSTMTPAGESPVQDGGGGSFSNPGFGFIPENTFTPTATRTPTERSNIADAGLTEPAPEEIVDNAKDSSSHTSRSDRSGPGISVIPCIGTAMVLAGLILFISRRRAKFKTRLRL